MIICIVGPTGVGKTKLSLYLAKLYDGIIINADSCQIYKELNIGTAKIKKEETLGIEHYLFDIKNANEEYSVSDYQEDLRYLLKKYNNRNIIVVGGTGLYIKAAFYDYEFSPITKKDYSKYSNEELLSLCKKIDPDIKIHVNNRRRLENYLNRDFNSHKKDDLLYDVTFIGLTTNRNNLYNQIDKRVDEMFKDGLIEEVDNLLKKYGETNILKRAIGYKEVIQYLKGELSKDDTLELIKKNTRHYAKRQYTWFNNQMNIKWFNVNYEDFSKTCEEVNDYIKKLLITSN